MQKVIKVMYIDIFILYCLQSPLARSLQVPFHWTPTEMTRNQKRKNFSLKGFHFATFLRLRFNRAHKIANHGFISFFLLQKLPILWSSFLLKMRVSSFPTSLFSYELFQRSRNWIFISFSLCKELPLWHHDKSTSLYLFKWTLLCWISQ